MSADNLPATKQYLRIEAGDALKLVKMLVGGDDLGELLILSSPSFHHSVFNLRFHLRPIGHRCV